MPLDGDPRAAWALLDHGKFEFRRSAYDVERAATKIAEIQLPRAALSTVEKNSLAFGYWTERHVEALITPRTKAIAPVHYAGVGCEMDEILTFCQARGIAVIEDNAHGLFGDRR